MEVRIEKWTPKTVPLEILSDLFTEFYQGYPWNEFLRCPECQPFADFGPEHTYGKQEAQEKQLETCPICGSKLERFWSADRIRYYLFDLNDMGEVILIDNKIAAWWSGRMMNKETLYLDVIAILPEYRLPPFRDITVNYFRKEIDRYHQEGGVNRFLSRTHNKAVHVQRFLKIFGFSKAESSDDDPDRSYWIIKY